MGLENTLKSRTKLVWEMVLVQARNLHPTTPLIYVHILCSRKIFPLTYKYPYNTIRNIESPMKSDLHL